MFQHSIIFTNDYCTRTVYNKTPWLSPWFLSLALEPSDQFAREIEGSQHELSEEHEVEQRTEKGLAVELEVSARSSARDDDWRSQEVDLTWHQTPSKEEEEEVSLQARTSISGKHKSLIDVYIS